MDYSKLTTKEKIELLNKAKDAYYNSDKEILSDAEFDELEKEVGLENKNYVGSAAGNYEIKHSIPMGSLSKTQVKEEKSGEVNWKVVAADIESYLKKSNGISYYETTPKLDGASFSVEFTNKNGKAFCKSVSTRGNGQYGTDIMHWFKPILTTKYWSKIDDAVCKLCNENSTDVLTIRGEILIPITDFNNKYSHEYVNPRAFVSGMLGIKYGDATAEKLAQGADLHFVCYDYRLIQDGKYTELSWMNPYDRTYNLLKPYLNNIGELPDSEYCKVYKFNGKITVADIMDIYGYYDEYRNNITKYALDGVVFKPNCTARKYNVDRPRPVDCVAMKFIPMINITKIVDIQWAVKKTGEYFPTAIVEPIIMPDGKKITRASLHNYDWIINNKTGIGSVVRISLAGDIIPFVYEVLETVDTDDNIALPDDGYIKVDNNSGAKHYMKNFTEEEEQKNKFLSSCSVLNINNIGPSSAEMLFDTLVEDNNDIDNIIYAMNDKAYKYIYDTLGTGKSIQNIVNSLQQYATCITIVDIIKSFCFKTCGDKAAEVCARIMSGLPYSTASLPLISYEWATNPSSRNYYLVKNAMELLDVDYLDEDNDDSDIEVTYVILTGSPEVCSKYKTKGQFLQAHPEFKETTSWKEVQMLITDSLESNSGKMQKARKADIPIRTYGDFENNTPRQSEQKHESNTYDFNKHIQDALF